MTTDAPRARPTRRQLKDHLKDMDHLRHYDLSDGSKLMMSADLAQGDVVIFMGPAGKRGLFARPAHPVFSGQVMDADHSPEAAIVNNALWAVSQILKDPRCRGVGVAEDNSLVIALDLSLYVSLKQTCGLGETSIPVGPKELFRHEAFTFVIAGATDHERGIGNA